MAATERDRKLALSAYAGHARRAALAAKGYVRLTRLRTGRRGSAVVLVELTDRATRLLDAVGVPSMPLCGRRPLARLYYQWQVAGWAAARGWAAEIASADFGADVVVLRGADRLGVVLVLPSDDGRIPSLSDDRSSLSANMV